MTINEFISEHITHRALPFTSSDMAYYSGLIASEVNNKRVLVVGGAGSIGSSFISSILNFRPSSIVVVDLNENGLVELIRRLRASSASITCELVTYPMDFSSSVFKKMFSSRGGFDIVANFSAHKHVRSEKDVFSVEALLRNNLLNAKKLLDLLSEYPPEVYFCVSTDKAANPVNIMGASKRIMEDVIFSYSDNFFVKTARFANVAFSNGSLLDGFLHRIEKLQPLSAPYDVKRYFISPEESGQICLLSAVLGRNREIFFPKLDKAQMMTFDVIAGELIKQYGYEVLECQSDEEAIMKAEALKHGSRKYPVHFSASDTSGEKLFEEFVTDTEETDLTRFSSLGVIINKEIPDKKRIDTLFAKLEAAFSTETSKEEIVSIIKDYLPNFEHIETGKSLDSKM